MTTADDVLALLSARDHHYVRDFTDPVIRRLHQHAFSDARSGRVDAPEPAAGSSFTDSSSISARPQCTPPGRQACSQSRPMSKRRCRTAPGSAWSTTWDFPPACRAPSPSTSLASFRPEPGSIRITTNLQIYWDQILVDNGPAQPNRIRTTELPLASATLAFRGYPRQVEGETPGDLTYYYDQASTTGPFSQFRGSYTRYGDVTSLLQHVDDQFVVFGTGEDIDAEFSAAPLPPLADGWTRDYFFYANGFVKDMDFYEATPFTVADMPFHAMTAYPTPRPSTIPTTAGRPPIVSTGMIATSAERPTRPATAFTTVPRTIDPEPLTPQQEQPSATESGQSSALGEHR